MRLYTLVENDRNYYVGVNRKVSVYELITTQVTNESEDRYKLLDAKHIYGRRSGWETFTVTSAVRRWIHTDNAVQILQVRIESVFGQRDLGDLDIDTTPHNQNEPLLVVFTNDARKRQRHRKELTEMINHEMLANDVIDDENSANDLETSYQGHGPQVPVYEDEESENMVNEHIIQKREAKLSPVQGIKSESKREKNYNKEFKKKEFDYYEFENKRPKRSRKKSRRNSCRRKPMYVDFQAINWDMWIIAPQGYQVSL